METDPCRSAGASIKCALVVQADAIDDAQKVSRSSRVRKSIVGGKSCRRTEVKRAEADSLTPCNPSKFLKSEERQSGDCSLP
jgi:hypothetical protein